MGEKVPRFVDKKTEIITFSNMFNPGLKVKILNTDFHTFEGKSDQLTKLLMPIKNYLMFLDPLCHDCDLRDRCWD